MRFKATALALGICSVASYAQERAIDNFAGLGVRAMGMGGAYVGVAEDFTAVFWNPAGLAQIKTRQLNLSLQRNAFDNETTSDVARTNSQLNNTRFGSMGFVYPYPVYRGSLVFGGGFNRLKDFDSSVRLKAVGPDSLLQDNQFIHEGELTLTTLAGAVAVSPSVSLGLALNIINGADENRQEFTFRDTFGVFLQEERLTARVVFEDDYKSTYTANIGILVSSPQDTPQVQFGANLTTGASHTIRYTRKGIAHEAGYDFVRFDDGSEHENVIIEEDGTLTDTRVEENRGSYVLSLPLEFGVGISVKPTPDLLISSSAHFSEWSQTEYTERDADQLRADAVFYKQYEDVVRYHVGAEWEVPTVALNLRAGFYTDPVPFVGPRSPESDVDPINNPSISVMKNRRFITLGAGLTIDQVVQLDVAWARGTSKQVEGRSIEDNTLNRVYFGLSYGF